MSQIFCYRLSPARADMLSGGPTPAETAIITEHFEYLQRAVHEGTVLFAGRTLTTDAESFGLCVFRADDEPAAAAFMNADPAVSKGALRARLFPFRVALVAAEWGL
jgi:uncharacterized protein YciI